MLTLVIDTETTGFPPRGFPVGHVSQPAIVQLGAILYKGRQVVSELNVVTIPRVRETSGLLRVIPIPAEASNVHGITDETVEQMGMDTLVAITAFLQLAKVAERIVAYNMGFDRSILWTAMLREMPSAISDSNRFLSKTYCAMLAAANHFKTPGRRPGEWAWSTLQEAYKKLVDPAGFEGAHDAMADVRACAAVTWALEDHGVELVKVS